MNNLQLVSDQLWQLAEQLLEVEDQNSVADVIEKLSALSQEFQPRECRLGSMESTPVPVKRRLSPAGLMLY